MAETGYSARITIKGTEHVFGVTDVMIASDCVDAIAGKLENVSYTFDCVLSHTEIKTQEGKRLVIPASVKNNG